MIDNSARRTSKAEPSIFRLWFQIAAVCAVLVLSVGAGQDLSARYDKLGHAMMCTCGCNQVLLECNHVGCTASTQMEGELRNALNRGDNDHLILQNFVQKYGPPVLAAPPQQGFDILAWIMPGLVFLLGTLGAAFLIRRWQVRMPPASAQASTDPKLEAIRSRIHQETQW